MQHLWGLIKSLDTLCTDVSLKVPAKIVYDIATKVLDTEIFPQHTIAALNSGITFIVSSSQEKPLRWKEINTHTQPSVHSISTEQYKESLVQQYPHVLKEIGKLKHHKAKFYIDKSVPPVAAPSRPIPFNLQDWFESKICKMEEADITEPHTGSTPWMKVPYESLTSGTWLYLRVRNSKMMSKIFYFKWNILFFIFKLVHWFFWQKLMGEWVYKTVL